MSISRLARWLLVLGLVSLPLVTVAQAAKAQDSPPTGGEWSTVGGNVTRTSEAAGSGPMTNPAVLWHFTHQNGGFGRFSRPVLVANGIAYVSTGDEQPVFALDQMTGEVKWRADFGLAISADDAEDTFSATVHEDTLYVAGSEGEAQCDCPPPAALYAVDTATGRERWRTSLPDDMNLSVPAVADGLIVLSGLMDESFVVAFDTATGSEQWRVPLGPDIGSRGSVAVANGVVYLSAIRFGYGGLLIALDAATGAERWRAETDGFPRTYPSVLDDTLYLVTYTDEPAETMLLAVDATTGSERWRVSMGEDVGSWAGLVHLTVTSELVYIDLTGFGSGLNPSSRVLALDTATGTEAWRLDGIASALVAGEVLYASSVEVIGDGATLTGSVYALDAATGTEQWRLDGPYGVQAVAGGMLFAVGTGDVWAIAEWSGSGTPAVNEVSGVSQQDTSDGIEEPDPSLDISPMVSIVNSDGSGLISIDQGFNPVWSPDGALIAYEGFEGGESDVFVINADGTNPRAVVTVPGYDTHPTWSPDGSRIAFMNGNGGYLYVANVDGTGLLQLSWLGGGSPFGDPFFQRPSWSPDGTKIAFAADLGDGVEIWVINADGTGLTQLTMSAAVPAPTSSETFETSVIVLICPDDRSPFDAQVEVIPNGDTEAYEAGDCIRVGAGAAEFVVLGSPEVDGNTWTLAEAVTDADGVAYLHGNLLEDGGFYSIQHVGDLGGVFAGSGNIVPPFDETYLVIFHVGRDSNGLPIINLDDLMPPPPDVSIDPPVAVDDAPPIPAEDMLFPDPEEIATGPAWSPDGKWIAYVALVGSDFGGVSDGGLWIMNPDGSGQTKLTDIFPFEVAPVWSSDSTRLLFGSGWTEIQVPDLYIIDVDALTVTQVTATDGPEFDAVWSPDSARIAFVGIGESGWDLFIANGDGTGVVAIVTTEFDVQSPAWAPNGEQIAFSMQPPYTGSGE